MPVNAGEVEAVLSARDTMSPVLVAAAEQVKRLTVEVRALGAEENANVSQLANLTAELGAARIAFQLVKDGVNDLAVANRIAAQRVEELAASHTQAAQTVTEATTRQLTAFERSAIAQGTLADAANRHSSAEEAAAVASTLRIQSLLKEAEAEE